MILHISNDYSGSTVYKNLIAELDNLAINQIVYNPIRDNNRIGKNKIDFKVKNSKIIYSYILNNSTDRFFYKNKINKITKDIESKVDLSKITFIHAHTWYSDGGVAYLLHKKYNIPFIIAIRSTDLKVHYKYFIHYRKFGLSILNKAKKIIVIGKHHQNFLENHIKANQNISQKVRFLPNGVESFWIENAKKFNPSFVDQFKIIYVGTFIKRKKLVELQEAIIDIATNENLKCELHIVGGGGDRSETILNNINNYPHLFKYHGKIHDQKELLNLYNACHLFAMPSISETFGLVYVEALLQGKPILFTHNEGIDGLYKEIIGEKVISCEISEIKNKLMILFSNYDSYHIPTNKLLENHNWQKIALKYQEIYHS